MAIFLLIYRIFVNKEGERMSESVFIGDIGEQIAICMFVKSGFTVSKPITNNSRYDLIVDINNKSYKVQVKTTENIKNNIMSFATKTTNYTKGKWKSKSYKIDDIDFFFLYCMENNWCGLYIYTKRKNIDRDIY